MSRKSLILCLAALAIMTAAIAAAVFALYKDTADDAPEEGRYLLMPAIPADAVAVCCLSDVSDISSRAFAGFSFPAALSKQVADGKLGTLAGTQMAFSLHYSGRLTPLYVFDAGSASPEPSAEASVLMDFGRAQGLQVAYVDCSSTGCDREVADRSIILMAETETLVKASKRHLEQSLSVMDVSGFADAARSAQGNDVLFVSYAHAKPLFSSMFGRKYFNERFGNKSSQRYSEFAGFLGSMGRWTAMSFGKSAPVSFSGVQITDKDAAEFMSVLDAAPVASSVMSEILPAYTLFAISLPMKDIESYTSAYEAYLDSKQMLSDFRFRQNELKKQNKVAPADFVKRLGVTEVAQAVYGDATDLSVVNLLKISKKDTVIFRGTGVVSFDGYTPEVQKFAFPSYAASVFGKRFALKDESCFVYVDGWLITGSQKAVEEFADGRATEYSLKEYMADAGRQDLIAARQSSFTAYLNVKKADAMLSKLLSPEIYKAACVAASDAEFCPAVMSVYRHKDRLMTDIDIHSLALQKTKAPEHDRDTVVAVPEGPFRVKNSGTGKMNLFYQNSSGAICLKEEEGKGLWGVPFGKPLCGTAHNVDYYANGKLQIIFGAESSIYLIDRLGRFVTGFPVDLGKSIKLGPDVYDFRGTKAYNIMVLHKDNTIEMYNLKGQKPSIWKGITANETIKALPERIDVGGKTFWVVRTSIQTLIFPFEGGAPVTSFKGQDMILPNSRVEVKDASSVEVECYDGRLRTVTLK
ncbi:MAG: hypothetical protein IKW27_07770 [Bacteroidales bacterium]|nr:hypothetical protein [Bacteroidales bacterium]